MMEGSSARTPLEMSSGLATACLTTPMATAGLPLKRTETRSSKRPALDPRPHPAAAPDSRDTCLTMMAPNWSGSRRSVSASTVNSVSLLSMRPAGTSTFCVRSAFSTSCGVRL